MIISFNPAGVMNRNGFDKVHIGMRSDIAIRAFGKSIIPDKALTEDDINCYYAYSGGQKGDLEFTYKKYHLIRIDCWDKKSVLKIRLGLGTRLQS